MLLLRVLWAAPASLIGIVLGLATLATGGSVRREGRVLEFWGRTASWLLRRAPIPQGAPAITFGHVVLGRTRSDLDATRRHELEHVRQYERWGPFFLPAYLLCWLVLRLCKRNGYYDNPFERAARTADKRP